VGYTSIGGTGLFFPQSTTSIPDHAIWPYVQQWHLDVQRDLIKHAVATLAYVGAKGTHLTLQHELNQLAPIPASRIHFFRVSQSPMTSAIPTREIRSIPHSW